MPFSKNERLVLANQYRILALLDEASADYHRRAYDALENGFELPMEGLLDHISDGLNVSGCGFVIDCFSMYGALQQSFNALGDKSGLKQSDLVFLGFDGNNETEYVSYARYVVEQEDRFTYVDTGHSQLNSHMPSVPRYRTMLHEWKNRYGQSHEMSADQIRAVLNTR